MCTVSMAYLQITFRIFSIMGLLLFLILITGRRKIGELPVFDFLAIIILGSVVGADIADPKVPHLPTAYAVALIIVIQFLLSHIIMKNRALGGKLTFGPTVVIQNGQFVKQNMKRLKYTIDDVIMHLRDKDVFDLSEVEFAIVEDSGKISVLKKSQFQPLTPSDMHILTTYKGMSIPIILDGKVKDENLVKLNFDREWLLIQLKNNEIDRIEDVFYMEINTQGRLYISKEVAPENIINDIKL